MAEHTREPWQYHADSRFVVAHIDDGEGLLICEVTDTHEGLEGDCPAADANGHLLAAAPDLLAVCERVHGLLLADQDILTEEDWRAVGKQLYAAIAKATGATP